MYKRGKIILQTLLSRVFLCLTLSTYLAKQFQYFITFMKLYNFLWLRCPFSNFPKQSLKLLCFSGFTPGVLLSVKQLALLYVLSEFLVPFCLNGASTLGAYCLFLFISHINLIYLLLP